MMSDLQLALIAFGALIIVAVLIVNWWQERRLRQQISEHFAQQPTHDDPLLKDTGRQEEFRMDVNTIAVDDEPVILKKAALAPTDIIDNEDEPELNASLMNQDLVNSAVADAVSAVAEFEEDMASDSEELPAAPLLDEENDDWNLPDQEIVTTAPIEELLEEAGLDAAVAEPTKPVIASNVAKADTETDSLPASMNHQIDLIAELFLPTPTTGAALREFLLSIADLDKPIYAYGLGVDGVWRMLTREQESSEFKRAACSLQLADRSGPVSSKTLNRFQQAVDQLGQNLSAQINWVGDLNPANYANELDQFCIEVDKLVGFHLVQGASGPFTGTKFRGLAEAGGLVLGEDGAFHAYADNDHKLYSLVNQDQNPFSPEMLRTAVIRGVTFQLDIPRVKNCAEVFNQMVLLARQMESSLNGRLVDDNQKQLDEAQIERIRQQLKIIQAKMIARGIVPGSAYALRLFS